MEIIKTQNLSKKYNDFKAVNNINIQIYEGELFALLGENGAGKTTTIKMLSGLIKPTSGDFELFPLKNLSVDEKKHLINISPQDTAISMNLSVEENLEMISRIYGHNKKQSKEAIENILNKLNLKVVRDKKAKKLSGGMQRRLSIAMALITQPKLLFLDEPTLGLDVRSRRELWEYIKLLKKDMSIILTTHYLEEIVALSDRVGIMKNGVVEIVGTFEEIVEKSGKSNFEEAFLFFT
jgi:ABC-2 type transport system ATP-binding protein